MTAPVFDKFSYLDPQRAARQMADAHGSAVIDRWGLLDPERARREIDAAFGTTLTNFDVLDPAAALRDVAASGGGTYHANAVRIGGNFIEGPAGIGGADSSKFSFAGQLRCSLTASTQYLFLFSKGDPVISDVLSIAVQPDGTLDFAMLTQDFSGGIIGQTVPGAWAGDADYHSIFATIDTGVSPQITLEIDHAAVTWSGSPTVIGPYVFPFSEATFYVSSELDVSPLTGDVSNWWLAPNVLQIVDTPFFDPTTHKPKDPSGYPAAAILLTGNAATFVHNQGTAGDVLTLTGAALTDATSPND